MSEVVKSSNGRGRPRKYPYPSQLVCSVSGKLVKTNPTQFKNQLEKSGLSQEEYIRTYICRSARKQIKAGNPVEKVEAPAETSVPSEPFVPPFIETDGPDSAQEPAEKPVGENKVWGEVAEDDSSKKE